MKISFIITGALLFAASSLAPHCVAQGALNPTETPVNAVIIVPGGDFETPDNWTIKDEMSTFSGEQFVSGKTSLRVKDESETLGSDVASVKIPVGPGMWKLRGQIFPVSGQGLAIYVRLYDDKGKFAVPSGTWQRALPNAPRAKWSAWSLDVRVPDNAKTLDIWVHSYSKAQAEGFIDDLSLQFAGAVPTSAPWTPQYKIKASEVTRLTRADVVGPDGLVYPDWRMAGVPGGIPDARVVENARKFGALPNDGKDDSDALERALEEVGARGGGALTLEAGQYLLARPIRVLHDNVVLRGAGMDATKIDFAYRVPADGVKMFDINDGDTVSRATWLEAHADYHDLEGMEIWIDGQRISQKENVQPQHWGGTFTLRTTGDAVLKNAAPDQELHELKSVAVFKGGRRVQSIVKVKLDDKDATPARIPSHIGGIMFVGIGKTGDEIKLARDGKRGDVALAVADASSFQIGDRFFLLAPTTARWNALVDNARTTGTFRRNEYQIEKIDGNTITINQPLRIDFPVVDGSFVQKILPIRNCGVEDLSLEQTTDNWTSGIIFSNAWDCFARRVHIVKPGRWPVYFVPAKNCEIRDCRFDDAWWKGGGGTAYVGWEFAYDCLMDNVRTTKLRHAPLVQWSAAGNVVRNSVFEDSDGQWHSGWTHENLFENCTIDSKQGNGSYGYGLWASPPEDEAHGPNGPRNVVYNCDIKSEKAGLWLGGMNEGWMVLHNRFDVAAGVGIYAKDASFDHTIWNNTFILRDEKSPALQLGREDCVGVEFLGNRISGGGATLTTGRAQPFLELDNTRNALQDAPRPQPKIASIFAWQREQK